MPDGLREQIEAGPARAGAVWPRQSAGRSAIACGWRTGSVVHAAAETAGGSGRSRKRCLSPAMLRLTPVDGRLLSVHLGAGVGDRLAGRACAARPAHGRITLLSPAPTTRPRASGIERSYRRSNWHVLQCALFDGRAADASRRQLANAARCTHGADHRAASQGNVRWRTGGSNVGEDERELPCRAKPIMCSTPISRTALDAIFRAAPRAAA